MDQDSQAPFAVVGMMPRVLSGHIFAESQPPGAVFCMALRAVIPQFIWAAGLNTVLWIFYRDVKYNLSVRIWLFTSAIPRHGNLYISFLS